MTASQKISLKEKIGYSFGDTAANIVWRTLTSFLLIFYTDVMKNTKSKTFITKARNMENTNGNGDRHP